jgi:general stress protein 26
MNELSHRIRKVIDGTRLAVLSTVTKDGKPMGRYVMTHSDDDLCLYSITSLSSRKIKQIQVKPDVHVTLGFNPEDPSGPFVSFAGLAQILTDKISRHAHWHSGLTAYFSDADDPEYCIIKMIPERIEYWAGMEPEIWTTE